MVIIRKENEATGYYVTSEAVRPLFHFETFHSVHDCTRNHEIRYATCTMFCKYRYLNILTHAQPDRAGQILRILKSCEDL